MAKLRPARCHRRLKRAFTRTSKYRKLSYIRGAPNHKIIHFDSGNKNYDSFPHAVTLYANSDVTLRHNAIEAGRIVATRYMAKVAGKGGFGLRIRTFPHHIIRENPIAMGAGADRMSQGMRQSYGKAISRGARVKKGKPMMDLFVQEGHATEAKIALKKVSQKFPISCSVKTVTRKISKEVEAELKKSIIEAKEKEAILEAQRAAAEAEAQPETEATETPEGEPTPEGETPAPTEQ
tara:strand:- start:4784 stop:5491 length:708 start_codon:yes stop_codon:yes gene_type:complete